MITLKIKNVKSNLFKIKEYKKMEEKRINKVISMI
jgi:hypothetical protein